jgi:hypothetical protein
MRLDLRTSILCRGCDGYQHSVGEAYATNFLNRPNRQSRRGGVRPEWDVRCCLTYAIVYAGYACTQR